MRITRSRGPCRSAAWFWLAVLAVAVAASGCLPRRSLGFDADRLVARCGRPGESGVSEEQARCIGAVAGLRDTRRCPLQVEPADEGAAWRLHETCSGLEIRIGRSDGVVSAVRLGDGVAESP